MALILILPGSAFLQKQRVDFLPTHFSVAGLSKAVFVKTFNHGSKKKVFLHQNSVCVHTTTSEAFSQNDFLAAYLHATW